MRLTRRLVLSAAAVAAALAPAPASADVSASRVKAAYLYKIAAFVTWPPSAFSESAAPFRICVAGRDDIVRPLQRLAEGQRAWGRPVLVFKIAAGANASQCQILFRDSASVRLNTSAPVLTVTDRGSATTGAIEFFVEGSHVRFVIHRAEAERRGLTLSSKLLSVAAGVAD